jgi:hypothetical protein
LPTEDLRVFRVAEVGANIGQHEHGWNPVPVARHEAKLILGQAVEFDPSLDWPALFKQDELQGTARVTTTPTLIAEGFASQ